MTKKAKLCTYRTFKSIFGVENYVLLKNRCLTSLLSQFRIGILPLKIETGRFQNIPVDERLCDLCNTDIEDEYHFLMACPKYAEFRQQMITNVSEKYPEIVGLSLTEKFRLIVQLQFKELATFLDKAWHKRKALLYSK